MKQWHERAFAGAFAAVGMWVPVQILYAGRSEPFTIYAEFCKPDVNPMTGVQSSDYELEYQHNDAPKLSEGDQVIVDGDLFRLRQDPRVDGAEATGFFRKALLTKQGRAC